VPNPENFHRALLVSLQSKGHHDIASLLSESRCEIFHGGQFSGKRWNAFWTTVQFLIPIRSYNRILQQIDEQKREIIRATCDEIMPPSSGLDVMGVKFSLLLDEEEEGTSSEELEGISEQISQNLGSELLPQDLKEKAKEMAEVYSNLYCVENALRLFIITVGKNAYKNDYMAKLNINADMKRKIEVRKKSVEKIKWLNIRGDSDIYYLDIDDLSLLITNNWNIFNTYFESQAWISTNIKEIADCRNPIAHNSYLDETGKDVIRINFIKIIKQISSGMTEQN
jgi:hypothetical protein